MVFKAASWGVHYSSPNVRETGYEWISEDPPSAGTPQLEHQMPLCKTLCPQLPPVLWAGIESLKWPPDCDMSQTGKCNPSESQQQNFSRSNGAYKTTYLWRNIFCASPNFKLLAEMWWAFYLFSITQWMMINEKKNVTGLIKSFILTKDRFFSCKLRDLFSP